MKKFLIIWAFILILFGWAYSLITVLNRPPEREFIKIPDTIKIHEPYIPPKDYNDVQPPEIVYEYITDTLYKDSIIYIHVNNDSLLYSSGFLINYPTTPKLINLSISHQKLILSLYHPIEGLQKMEFPYMEGYQYNFNHHSQLTYKKPKWYKSFYLTATYIIKPLINHHDINLLLNFETGKINYIGGIGIYYLPGFKNSFGLTPIMGITYRF